MSAASSPAGRAFAMKTSDLLVTVLGVAGEGLAPVRALSAQRKAEGRPLQIITTTHVVCRETDREAEDYYRHYAVDNADTEAVDYHMNMSRRNRQLDTEQIFNERKRYAGGLSSHPLIGSPETIVAELSGCTTQASTASRCHSSISRTNCRSSSNACCRCCNRPACGNKTAAAYIGETGHPCPTIKKTRRVFPCRAPTFVTRWSRRRERPFA